MTTINDILSKAKELKLEIEAYKVNDSKFNYERVESLHTDTCNFVDFGIDGVSEDDIVDWRVVSPDDYNQTINANCGEIQDEDVIVVILKS